MVSSGYFGCFSCPSERGSVLFACLMPAGENLRDSNCGGNKLDNWSVLDWNIEFNNVHSPDRRSGKGHWGKALLAIPSPIFFSQKLFIVHVTTICTATCWFYRCFSKSMFNNLFWIIILMYIFNKKRFFFLLTDFNMKPRHVVTLSVNSVKTSHARMLSI